MLKLFRLAYFCILYSFVCCSYVSVDLINAFQSVIRVLRVMTSLGKIFPGSPPMSVLLFGVDVVLVFFVASAYLAVSRALFLHFYILRARVELGSCSCLALFRFV